MKLTLYEHLYLIVKYRLREVFYHTLVSCQVEFFIIFSTQIFKTPLEVLKKTRRYLLSRFHNYHRLQALSFRIRDGNGRFHLDMVAGRLPIQFSPNRQFPF